MLNNQRVLADLYLTNTQHSWKEWVDMSRRRLECLSEDVAHPIRISYHHRPSLRASPISLDKSSSEARVFIGWISWIPGFISSHIEIATLADWTRYREIIILHNHHLKYRGPSCRNPASPFHPFWPHALDRTSRCCGTARCIADTPTVKAPKPQILEHVLCRPHENWTWKFYIPFLSEFSRGQSAEWWIVVCSFANNQRPISPASHSCRFSLTYECWKRSKKHTWVNIG